MTTIRHAAPTLRFFFQLEMVEGKDRPSHFPKPEFEEKGKTVGLLLRLTRSFWHTGRLVVLDSGFCVLKGISELFRKGVFASSLIKKRRYWPRHVPGDAIQERFESKSLGEVDILHGKMEGINVSIVVMKDKGYNMLLMSSYGTGELTRPSKMRSNGQSIQYPDVVANHYAHRGAVDEHNSQRMSPAPIEVAWRTKWWPSRVFSFLLGVTKINVKMAMEYLYKAEETTVIQF